MIGGDKEIVEALKPLFQTMGKTIVHQGPAGAGQHTKMVNQMLIASNMIGVCEALLYGYKAGLDLNVVLESVSSGAAGSWSLSNLGPRMIAGNFEPGFFVEHFLKDMGIALAEARRMKLSLPGLALSEQLYRAVEAQGYARQGHTRLDACPRTAFGDRLERPPKVRAPRAAWTQGRAARDRKMFRMNTLRLRGLWIKSAFRSRPATLRAFRGSCIAFPFPSHPEENAWPVVDAEKDVVKSGARSAGCAAGFAIARSNAAKPRRRVSSPPPGSNSLTCKTCCSVRCADGPRWLDRPCCAGHCGDALARAAVSGRGSRCRIGSGAELASHVRGQPVVD